MKKYVALSVFMSALAFGFLYFKAGSVKTFTEQDFRNYKIEEEKEESNLKNDQPDKAMLWYYQQRAYPNNSIPENWREEAYRHISLNNVSSSNSPNALTWTQLGPGNIGGRIRAIAVHPSDPNTVYFGAVAGGVWKSVDGGTTWTALNDFMGNLAVCALVIDPNNPNTIYAGTGEGFFNLDAIRGAGIFKSTDAGASWSQLASTNNLNFYYVNDLDYDAVNSTLYAATRKGLYSSNDGGANFTAKVTAGGNDANCMDIEIALTSPRTIYATFGLFSQAQIWQSVDAGANFVQNMTLANFGRIEMAVSKSNPAVAYASFMDLSTYGTGAIIYTTNTGNNWFYATVPGPSYAGATTYTGAQAWYDNILAVDPDNANNVLAGGIDNWKTTNGGTSWVQKTNWFSQSGAPPYAHADQHCYTFAPSNSNIVYLGNDGGIYKSTNKGETWASLNNNLFITQFYYGAVNPTGTVYAGGTQDNGTLRTTGSASWTEILGGDGGATEIDFSNTNNIYMEYVNLAFFKSTNGGASFFKAMNGIPLAGSNTYDGTSDRTQFISPFSMDPNNSSTIVAGTYRVWRTLDGAANWSAISGDLTGDGSGTSGATISTVIAAKGNPNVIYAGCSNGRVQVTTDGGSSWNLRTSGLPNLSVTRITSDPTNPATAYVTFSGYTASSKIFKTTNYGTSWTNVSGNLPNIPTNCAVVNPANGNNLFVGTDLGVFSTTDGGSNWVQDVTGMANVPVLDLDYRASDNKLFAATHGRSMYSSTLTGGGGTQTANLVYDDGTPGGGYYWNNNGQGSANRMSPTLSNATLTKMEIYITGVNSGTATYKPIVFGNNGGSPGNDLAPSLGFKTAATYPAWDATELSPLGITVNSDFYVGLKYDGVNKPTYGYDVANNGRAWDFDGTNWAAWNETYFMRATIQTVTSVAEISNEIPKEFDLSFNYPNPFNPTTRFRYSLPEGRNVKIIIYDINGSKVTELVNNYQGAGTYEVTWNGKNDIGQQVASGTYIYQVNAGNFSQTKKMILLK
ncbi:MAG: T9SS type A sorting domain-containing protein [Ignavibacteriales bacterium]|nr:T9SS type A sorting domain-containing protein [Ignavibacteriales bacterium]